MKDTFSLKTRRGRTNLAVLAALVAALVYLFCFLPLGLRFELYERTKKEVILSVPVQMGDHFSLEIEHSFDHTPWYEYYTVKEDLTFNLDSIAVAGFGAGTPAEMDVPTYIGEDGLVHMDEINSVFDHFQWLTSDKYMKSFRLNGEEIFDFRSLPDASRVRGDIINRKGLLSLWQKKY